jgi:hypothetical protein
VSLFGWVQKVPETITQEQMDGLSRRAQKAEKESMFSRRNVEKRLASSEQKRKRGWS